ncbi:MAG: hypothetical protein WCE23_04580 [Candidatus Binatus sp.]
MLRIHARNFARRDAKEVRVELVDVLDETTPARDNFARRRGIRIVKIVQVEAIRRNFPDCIHCVAKQIPESSRVRCARKAAADPDYGDRFGARLANPARCGVRLRRAR